MQSKKSPQISSKLSKFDLVVYERPLRPILPDEKLTFLLRNCLLKLTSKLPDLGPIENVKGCKFTFHIHAEVSAAKSVIENHQEVPWEIDDNNEMIWDFIAQKIPVMNSKDNDFEFSIHIDKFNKDMQS